MCVNTNFMQKFKRLRNALEKIDVSFQLKITIKMMRIKRKYSEAFLVTVSRKVAYQQKKHKREEQIYKRITGLQNAWEFIAVADGSIYLM